MNSLKRRLTKIEEVTVTSEDPKWRERRAREFAREWMVEVEPLFAEIYGRGQTEQQVYADHMKILNLYPTETEYKDFYLNQGKQRIDKPIWEMVKEKTSI